MIRDEVAYLFDFSDTPLYAFSEDVIWETEDLEDSTNRLLLYVPNQEAEAITTDQDVYFQGRKYTIVESDKDKNSDETVLTCDEIQVRLSDVNNPAFTLRNDTLRSSMRKALARTGWTVGETLEDERTYNAELKNESAMRCLRFLQSQSGGRLRFDSVNKVVHLVTHQETLLDYVLRYGRNISNIKKNETQPQATVLYPYGKDGMTIEAVNNSRRYIEDFSWYTGLGMTISQARAKYQKELVWSDERYIYNGNLYRDAVARLALLSQPQINYQLEDPDSEVAQLPLGSFVYVDDEEFGIKIKTRIARIKRSKQLENYEIELNYIPPSLGTVEDNFIGDSSQGSAETSFFVVKNKETQNVTSIDTEILVTSITVFAATAFEVNLALQLECVTAGLLEGYWTVAGDRVPTDIKQTLQVGFHTIGLPFAITQVQEGTQTLRFFLKTSGSVRVDPEKAEMYIKSQGVFGGASNNRPDQTIAENIELTRSTLTVTENYAIAFEEG